MAYKNPADKREWRKQYRARFPQKHAEWKSAERQRIDARVCGAHVDAWREHLSAGARKAKAIRNAKKLAERERLELDRAKLRMEGKARCCRCNNEFAPIGAANKAWLVCRSCRNEYMRARRLLSPESAKIRSIRGTILRAIKFNNITTPGSVVDRYLGCSPPLARAYIQDQFSDGMSWDNHGSVWHIDHVLPLASFDLGIDSERARAFHYTNLRPLLVRDNILKSDRITVRKFQPGLPLGEVRLAKAHGRPVNIAIWTVEGGLAKCMCGGREVLIDASDIPIVRGAGIYLRKHGYAELIFGGRRTAMLHRLLLGLARGDKRHVDHINRNPSDNRRSNLRVCTVQQNSMNRGPASTYAGRPKSSRYKGVSYDRITRKWRAIGVINRRLHRLGRYADEAAAAAAYDAWAIKTFGEFACTNFSKTA